MTKNGHTKSPPTSNPPYTMESKTQRKTAATGNMTLSFLPKPSQAQGRGQAPIPIAPAPIAPAPIAPVNARPTQIDLCDWASSFQQRLDRYEQQQRYQNEQIAKQNAQIENQQNIIQQLLTIMNNLNSTLTRLEQRMSAPANTQEEPVARQHLAPSDTTPSSRTTQPSSASPPKGSSDSIWADIAKKGALHQHKPIPKVRRQKALRLFTTPPTGNSIKFNLSIIELRPYLREIGINTYRVLDVMKPEKGVVGLLIHSDYSQQLKTQLEDLKIEILTEYDPTNPTVLQDPKFGECNEEDRTKEAYNIHNKRCIRGLQFMRTPELTASVARNCHRKGWITEQQLESFVIHKIPDTQHKVHPQAPNEHQNTANEPDIEMNLDLSQTLEETSSQ